MNNNHQSKLKAKTRNQRQARENTRYNTLSSAALLRGRPDGVVVNTSAQESPVQDNF